MTRIDPAPAPAPAPAPTPTPAPALAPASTPETLAHAQHWPHAAILVVDDEPGRRNFLLKTLPLARRR